LVATGALASPSAGYESAALLYKLRSEMSNHQPPSAVRLYLR
jgi:hypothetical protein